ncbi:hypothetical protein DFH06DRAFT_215941 [Mycena polygramma]|nr:hypothetical protein DFH06DRAFT_215941 [Mycena polygramma]
MTDETAASRDGRPLRLCNGPTTPPFSSSFSMSTARGSLYAGVRQDSPDEFNPYSLEEKAVPVPPGFRLIQRRAPRFPHLLGWPALVVFGQLFLQAIGWTFLAVVRSHGPIALPFSTAVAASNNPHIVTLVATLISTLFAASSSFFFSYALRRSMSLYLLRPVSLAALGASVNISMRSFVFHRRHWKWPAVSLLCLIMAGIQTSVWSTLITPVKIVISTPIVGHEIDLSSPNFLKIWDERAANVCQTYARDGAVYGGVPDSGYANGQSHLGLPASVSLLGQGFNVSTRGISPATLNDTHVGAWSIPAAAQTVGPLRTGISDSYSMAQQGFTANVSCALQNLTSTTSPDIEVESDIISGWSNGTFTANGIDRINVSWVSAASSCWGTYLMNVTDAYYDVKGEYMWAISCDPLPSSPNAYTMVFKATGNYTDLTGAGDTSYLVCHVAPATTDVHVEYAGDINVTVSSVAPPSPNAGGPAGFFAMYVITDLVWHQQAVSMNAVANQLQELLSADSGLTAVEQYLQGVVEYSASILRACLSADNMVFTGGVPSDITRSTNGTWDTETLGWKRYSTATTIWILVPGLFMACSTLALVMVAIYRHGSEMQTHSTTFDPSNPLHLMAAAAAGGLNNVFRSLRSKDIHEGGQTTVMLGSVPGRGPALVRADTYTPLSTVTPLTSA